MRYLGFVIVAAAVYHTLSYARHCLGQGNKSASVGALLLALLTVGFAVMAMFVTG